jgi:hypothetical protein
MSIIKKNAVIDKDKYAYFISHFETEQDALNYLEINIDTLSRKYYKKKENKITIELNLLEILEPKLENYLNEKNISFNSLINKLIIKAIRK